MILFAPENVKSINDSDVLNVVTSTLSEVAKAAPVGTVVVPYVPVVLYIFATRLPVGLPVLDK